MIEKLTRYTCDRCAFEVTKPTETYVGYSGGLIDNTKMPEGWATVFLGEPVQKVLCEFCTGLVLKKRDRI